MTIKSSHFTRLTQVNGQVQCHKCASVEFEVAICVPDPQNDPGFNFLRVLQCCFCGTHIPIMHSKDELSPAFRNELSALYKPEH